ncbi:hypothetical protein EZJ19_14850 [Parasulfuritortus cantonensis]|uniref:Uncharacterized protein n=1 Tax=Parasulfuritortus cantonensis TaxID=2528202 RepID=A0A4R1B2L0_9PROT|nr:hypothetical protein [Parasulfuritortus cantonensis]TCJ11690.1 hypothetical protein EZJ19_14850 [Parasulfuritortus cantonensis]
MKPSLSRSRLVGRLRERLLRHGYPRLQMSLMVLLTGAAGFLVSALLLGAGLETMWLRYLCAFAVAYPVFLALLWLWPRTGAADYGEFADLSGFGASPSGGVPVPGGGHFGGAGASARFEVPAMELGGAEAGVGGDVGDGAADALDAVGDGDEFAVVLLVLVLLLAVLIASAWLVYTAPGLFAELTVDGALSAGLYRRLRQTETPSWLATALRRTWLLFALTGVAAVACAWWLQHLVPGAHSIGAVLARL